MPQVSHREVDILKRHLKLTIDRSIEGAVVELGCYTGGSAVALAEVLQKYDRAKKLHVYDSFEGLPEKLPQDTSALGVHFLKGELKAQKQQLITAFKKAQLPLPIIHKGWFEELRDEDIPHIISFAFLDGDYYSSIKTSLHLIERKMTRGGVIIIDDYANEALPGARLATDEWLKTHRYALRTEASLAIITVS